MVIWGSKKHMLNNNEQLGGMVPLSRLQEVIKTAHEEALVCFALLPLSFVTMMTQKTHLKDDQSLKQFEFI